MTTSGSQDAADVLTGLLRKKFCREDLTVLKIIPNAEGQVVLVVQFGDSPERVAKSPALTLLADVENGAVYGGRPGDILPMVAAALTQPDLQAMERVARAKPAFRRR